MTWTRQKIAAKAARELRNGETVNLGIGLPTLIPDLVPPSLEVVFHSENGMLGVGNASPDGPHDDQLINAGKQPVSSVPGTSFFDSGLSFAMIRGGHVDTAVLGAFQVSQQGDLANWMVPGKLVRGIGGAMDLVLGAKRVIVTMEHVDPAGDPKLVDACTLPVTGHGVVDVVITDRGVFDIVDSRLYLREPAPGVSADDLREVTSARFLPTTD